ncbi:hypothetical protein [Pseudomonas sp. UBA7530]|uniref:hypothetical protein n=1 Tax=Pseudomonas sp. UBA7530 TaxID=1947341 RepID=UPI0025DA64F6|nr:hypothetical protein [Pseudomonas sp. UBA7530]
MTTRVDVTGAFLIPTNSPMNGPTLIEQEVGDYESVRDLVGGRSVPIMAGVVAAYPDAQTLISPEAVAFRTETGWEIYLTGEALKLTTDSVMSEGSVVQTDMEQEPGLATLFQSSSGPAIPAFWTAFKQCSEDGFGGAGAGWVPDVP